ncbi:lipoic acid synthetase [Hydrogenobacter thermophilus TK-6]|uniref:Lipoyl synthase n=1 Tax=Hydrogenobacter thermophilus (strain DSM 6534 / IAM 12695 / TK-6) TaxID=608538 RepID=D3DGT9_HYDTT|nr:lipoyl synthase [Hydrogenobacter thermophilus]ADO44977.1 lipoic acid synthetase [Hydrogenobacter thermophilus TK-6]BAI69041.1 lipoyl synthase [Hydrogenobacter thermophilus TK-6]
MDWLKVKAPQNQVIERTLRVIKKYSLNTVCEESLCPNISECFSEGTATFMLMGKVCTRACKYCHVATGRPQKPDASEPHRLYLAVKELALKHTVLTSVDRDDLKDYGSGHFKRCVEYIKFRMPEVTIEVLVPDFRGDVSAMKKLISSSPDIIAHNIETVERLFKQVRPQGDYRRSLNALKYYADNSNRPVKSGIMVGLGESLDEILKTFEDLRRAGVSRLVIGQYLSPSPRHYQVRKYYRPEEFERLRELALSFGFERVLSLPLARSSYHAQNLV